MARRGRTAWWHAGAVLLGIVAWVAFSMPAGATMKFGPLQLSGNFETQNIVQSPNPVEYRFVQNRNVFNLRVDWDWLQKGKLIDRYNLPFIKQSKIYLLYRGVYDGVYDIAPSDRQRGITRFDDLVGGPIEGNDLGSCRDSATGELIPCDLAKFPNAKLREGTYSRYDDNLRDAYKFDNQLREAYIDFSLRDWPLSFRVGRQQVIWGESDQFRLMDIWNPLDLTWHLQQEPFEKIRVPLWTVKALWDTGTVGPFSNTFIEGVWNPGFFEPGVKVDFVPRPLGVPFPNPVRAGQVQINPGVSFPLLIAPVFDLQGTDFWRGNFERNPQDASDVGVRMHGVTPQGVEMTTNYFYMRGRKIGAFAGSPFVVDIQEIRFRGVNPGWYGEPAAELGTFSGQPVIGADVKAEIKHQYSHIFGFTANYFEGDLTQTVFRLETAYQLGVGVQSVDKDRRVIPVDRNGTPVLIPVPGHPCSAGNLDGCVRAPVGIDKRNVWAGMIGFDRPTWIRWLNERTTWFLSGQFFWSYVDGNADNIRSATAVTAGGPPYVNNPSSAFYPGIGSNGVGVWTSGPNAGVTERLQDSTYDFNADRIHQWEILTTLAATSFYRGGTIVPFIATAYDPVNVNFLAQLQVEYFYTNDFVITPFMKLYTKFGRAESLDPWGAGGQLSRRDELGLKLAYQF